MLLVPMATTGTNGGRGRESRFFLLSIALFVLSCVFVRKRFRFSFDVCDMLRHLTVAFILLDLGVAVDPLPPGGILATLIS